MINLKKLLLFFFFIVFHATVFADKYVTIESYDQGVFQKDIDVVYQNLETLAGVNERIQKISYLLLGKPYLLGALGEGPTAFIDKQPLYRTDAFDCLTFVSTVLAVALAHDRASFQTFLKKIQYSQLPVSYFHRCHFVELDWNATNHKNGFIRDITRELSPHYKTAQAKIDRRSWYRQHGSQAIKYFYPITPRQYRAILIAFAGSKEKPHWAYTDYIPLDYLFKDKNTALLITQQIPNGSILEIVDKNKKFKEEIGTDMNVVHVGFVFQEEGNTILRHASKVHGKVMDVLLVQYLKRYYELVKDPGKAGIHLERVNDY